MSHTTAAPGVAVSPISRRRVFTATLLGNIVEYYDFTLYGTLAAIISEHFFPQNDSVALISVYASIVLSYFIRPFGGLILGPIGDIKGRKFVLVFTIVLMSIGTAGIGFLPSYAAIGIAAPILLMTSRLVQGLGASVEYTTAADYLFEHEEGHRRNLVAGIINSTCSVGSLLASGIALLFSLVPGDFFTSWGWRIPFILAIPIAFIGVYMRKHLVETPEFEQVLERAEKENLKQTPLRDSLRLYWRQILQALGLSLGQRIGSYIIQAYFVTALITAGFPASQSLLISMLTYLVGPITSVWGGMLADRFGGRLPLVVGYGLFILLTVPTFYLIGGKSIWLAMAAVIVFTLINNIVAAPLSVGYVLIFPPEVRATAAALSFNIGTSLFGSTAGLVAVLLFDWTGSNVSFGWYVTVACAISLLIAIFWLPDALKYREPSVQPTARAAAKAK